MKEPNWGLLTFPVSLRPMYLLGVHGESRPLDTKRAVLREDTGQALAFVSKGYKLIPHPQIFRALHDMIEERLPYPVANVDTKVGLGGGYASVEWTLDHKVEVAKGDLVALSLLAKNSLDTNMHLSVELSAQRLICSNGLRGPGPRFRQAWKHYAHLDPADALEKIQALLDRGPEMVDRWKEWTKIKVFPTTLEDWLKKDTAAADLIGIKARAAMFERMRIRGELGRKITLWEAYNGLTELATHHAKTRKSGLLALRQEQLQQVALRFAESISKN